MLSPLLHFYFLITLIIRIQLVKPVYLRVLILLHTHTHTLPPLYTNLHTPGECAQKLFTPWSVEITTPDAPPLSLKEGAGALDLKLS